MLELLRTLDDEISNVNHLLESIPFENSTQNEYFVNVYRISYLSFMELNNQPHKFPIDSNKLLKLEISLGSLINTLQLNEDLYQKQSKNRDPVKDFKQGNQSDCNQDLKKDDSHTQDSKVEGSGRDDSNKQSFMNYDPFREQSKSSPLAIPIHHLNFVKNILIVLKNFDVVNSNYHPKHIYSSQSSGTLSQANGNLASTPISSTNVSPIKLTSKQLLIEKLEINIELDTIFIYKVLFKLIIKILNILREKVMSINFSDIQPPSLSKTLSNDFGENYSIFSTTSLNSNTSSLPLDEYLKFLRQIINRLSLGLIQPFYKFTLEELVDNNIEKEFTSLIDNL